MGGRQGGGEGRWGEGRWGDLKNQGLGFAPGRKKPCYRKSNAFICGSLPGSSCERRERRETERRETERREREREREEREMRER